MTFFNENFFFVVFLQKNIFLVKIIHLKTKWQFRFKKWYHWSKTCIICFYHHIPRLSAWHHDDSLLVLSLQVARNHKTIRSKPSPIGPFYNQSMVQKHPVVINISSSGMKYIIKSTGKVWNLYLMEFYFINSLILGWWCHIVVWANESFIVKSMQSILAGPCNFQTNKH